MGVFEDLQCAGQQIPCPRGKHSDRARASCKRAEDFPRRPVASEHEHGVAVRRTRPGEGSRISDARRSGNGEPDPKPPERVFCPDRILRAPARGGVHDQQRAAYLNRQDLLSVRPHWGGVATNPRRPRPQSSALDGGSRPASIENVGVSRSESFAPS